MSPLLTVRTALLPQPPVFLCAASGRWGQRIQKVLDKHGKSLEQECTTGVLATAALGHTAAATQAKPKPEGGSPCKTAGRCRLGQPRRGGRKPY